MSKLMECHMQWSIHLGLEPYFKSHQVIVLTSEPLKQVLDKPDQSKQLSKWTIELRKYNIGYQAPSAKKAQILTDFMADYPKDEEEDLKGPEQEKEDHLMLIQNDTSSQAKIIGEESKGKNYGYSPFQVHTSEPLDDSLRANRMILLGISKEQVNDVWTLQVDGSSKRKAWRNRNTSQEPRRSRIGLRHYFGLRSHK